jgi:hypothetical protein
MEEIRRCRLSVDGELQLAGPPSALRALSGYLRRPEEPWNVAVTGGSVSQEISGGPLLVSLRGTTLHFSGGRQFLGIVWAALDGVAKEAATADDRRINRHQHIEYFPGDEYRSPNSIPLVIVADWPDQAQQTTR